MYETLKTDGRSTPNTEIKVLSSLRIRREKRNELNLLSRWREWKKSFSQNKNFLTAKHENNTGFPIIPQQAGTETPPVAGWARHLLITSLHRAGAGLWAPNRSHPCYWCFHKKTLLPWDAKLWAHSSTSLLLRLTPHCLLHPDAWHCLELAHRAAQPQPEMMAASTNTENTAGVELIPAHPVKEPKL